MYANELNGFNGARRIFDEGVNISEEIEGQRATIPPPIFQIAVVVDVLNNPAALSKDDIAKMESESATPELFKRAPINSIIARVITRNQDRFDSSTRVFFPASVYDPEPIKPGEQVFVFFVDPLVSDQIGYWWKRVPQPLDTEDLNFTHADRRFDYNSGLSTSERFEGKDPVPPSFENGGGEEEQRTLANANDFKEIQKNARANKQIVREPVARFKKRPGDKVIQDSNGARIVLGLDRTGTETQKPRPQSSTIDFVVGSERQAPPTAPTAVLNSNKELEVDKTPEKKNTESNPIEGDPDFLLDKGRLYISEDTDVDVNFKFVIGGVPLTPGNSAAHAVRSDRVRLDARENIKLRAGIVTGLTMDKKETNIVSPIVNLGSAAPILGVARLTDEITVDATTDPAFFVWVQTLTQGLKALGVVLPEIVQIKGRITKASQKVKSE